MLVDAMPGQHTTGILASSENGQLVLATGTQLRVIVYVATILSP